MKREFAFATAAPLFLFVIPVVMMVLMLNGCSVKTHPHVYTPKQEKVKKRCKVLGKEFSSNVSVIVERNCLRNGLTTVSLVLLDKKNLKKAFVEGEAMMRTILGFKPKLSWLFYGKAKGVPYFLLAVTGALPP